jgi:UDP:flavonoid glycosyltransferase YjiC (YdhE family)
MRLLAACSLGGAGHLEPLLPFLAAGREHGVEILVVGPPALAEMVDHAGYPFQAGGEPPERDVALIRERLPVAPPREARRLAGEELFGRLATSAMLPAMKEVCSVWRPDLVLRDPCEYASLVVAGQRGIVAAQVAISLAEAEAGSLRVAASALEAHRRGVVAELLAEPYLTRFPASLDPSSFPTTLRYHEPPRPRARLPGAWWDDPAKPLVYMTYGTVLGHMSIAADVYRRAAAGLADLDVRVLLTVGRRFDLGQLGALPANLHVEEWLDQADVCAEAAVVVCHGGSGTVLGALAAGVPVVTAPMFADQFENSRRVAEAGAGLVVGSRGGSTGAARGVLADDGPARLAGAVEAVLRDAAPRRAAGEIAAEMRATPTANAVLGDLLARAAT